MVTVFLKVLEGLYTYGSLKTMSHRHWVAFLHACFMLPLWDLVSVWWKSAETYKQAKGQPPASTRWAQAGAFSYSSQKETTPLITGWRASTFIVKRWGFLSKSPSLSILLFSPEKHWDGFAFSIMPNQKCFSSAVHNVLSYLLTIFIHLYVHSGCH